MENSPACGAMGDGLLVLPAGLGIELRQIALICNTAVSACLFDYIAVVSTGKVVENPKTKRRMPPGHRRGHAAAVTAQLLAVWPP